MSPLREGYLLPTANAQLHRNYLILFWGHYIIVCVGLIGGGGGTDDIFLLPNVLLECDKFPRKSTGKGIVAGYCGSREQFFSGWF